MDIRIGFVATIRPLFQGDSPAAATRGLAHLQQLGTELGFEVVTPSLHSDVVHPATGSHLPPFAVHDEASAHQAAERLATLDLDMLLVQHTTFATGELLVPLLATELPIGLWALPEGAGGRGDRGPLPLNSLCGLNMTLSFLDRPEVGRSAPVKWLYGEADTGGFQERFRPTLSALRGLRALRHARILHIGGTAPHFYGLEEMPDLPGVQVDRLELRSLFERVAAVPREEARALAVDWARSEISEVGAEQLERAAALELALHELLAEGRYNALAMRCWPELPDQSGTMACATFARLGDGLVPAACEGDVMGALSMLALQGMSASGSLLTDLSDMDPNRGVFFWHCGNGPSTWSGPAGSRLRSHFNRAGVGTVRDMTIRPGPATGFRLLDRGGKAVIFAGTFADWKGNSEPPGFDGVRGWLQDLSWNGEPVDAQQFLANVLDYRLPHHFALGSGELTEGLQELCGWLEAETLQPRLVRNRL